MAVRLSAVLCLMAAAIIKLPDAQSRTTQQPRYDARSAFDTNGTYYMKYRNYEEDWVFGRGKCVSRWGGNDRRPEDPVRIRYETKNYDGDEWTYLDEIEVLFDERQKDTFHYDKLKDGKPENRKLIYLNLQEQCQVTETLLEDQQHGCTLWMGFDTVDEDPPTKCEEVYKECMGSSSTVIGYHGECKYEPLRKKKN